MMKPPSFLQMRQFGAHLKSTAAETLAEVLIALIVLAVGGGGALTLVAMSISNNEEAEERLMAYNFAREGVEAMRNIRDTNWLRFPSDRENCWDAKPSVDDIASCPTNQIAAGDYIVYPITDIDTNLFGWRLSTVTAATDTMICETTVAGETLYVHELGGCTTETPYNRVITITKGTDTMEVQSEVFWDSKGDPRSVVFMDKLTNY